MSNLLDDIYQSELRLLDELTPEDTYKIIIDEAMKIARADYGSIFLFHRNVLERVYASNPLLYEMKIRKRGYTFRAYKSGKPAVVPGAKIADIQPKFQEVGADTVMYIPISYAGKSLGVISLGRKNNKKVTDEELKSLMVFTSFASLAINKSKNFIETKQAFELRDYFISAAAHELRTPLTAIHGYAQLLHSKLQKNGNSETKWVDLLLNETNRLTHLVKELLEVNRIKSGKSDYLWSETSIVDILQKIINRLRYHYPHHKFQLENRIKEDMDVIVADHDRLLQALHNIIENGAQYSSVDTVVKITAESNKQNIILKIKDKGYGMSDDEISKVFDGHIHVTDEDKKGIGIGLFLVKNIIEKHHGILDIKSKVKKGTTVTVKLPKFNKNNG